MSYDRTYRRTTTTNRNRRPLYAPPPPPAGGGHRQHSLLSYWVPLVVTGTIALGGLAAWIWSERGEHDDDHYPDEKPYRPPPGPGNAPYPTQGSQSYPGPPPPSAPPGVPQAGPRPPYPGAPPPQQPGPSGPPPLGGEAASYYGQSSQSRSETRTQQDDSTFYGQVKGVMRRTPSPEQFFSHASKQVSAGMAAAGAVAGAALSSIMEEDHSKDRFGEQHEKREEREGFSDHERWSEEAEEIQKQKVSVVDNDSERRIDAAKNAKADKGKGKTKKVVAVVVTADTNMDGKMDEDDLGYKTEHASILSHLPAQFDSESTDLFVLIYAPGLKSLPPLDYQPFTAAAGSTIGSSPSAINTPAVTPGSELADPHNTSFTSPSQTFDALYQTGLSLTQSSQILPFTTLRGYVPLLRHLGPQTVYVSDMLAGNQGEGVAQLKGWVGHTILVVGDDGTGGLADTETEDETPTGPGRPIRERWYESSSLVGLGKEIEVVDVARVGDDWARRVGGRE